MKNPGRMTGVFREIDLRWGSTEKRPDCHIVEHAAYKRGSTTVSKWHLASSGKTRLFGATVGKARVGKQWGVASERVEFMPPKRAAYQAFRRVGE